MAVYDAEIEWIEFKAGAYVNTGIYPTSLDLDIWYLADDYVSFGWIYNKKANNTWIGAIKKTIWWKNYSSKNVLTVTSYGVKRFKMNEGFFDGGILRQAFTASLGSSQIASIPLYIGGPYDANVSAMSTNANDYSGKPKRIAIYQGSTLVRDFIPVRVGQVGYLYDKVSDTLFGSDGTENFTLGADRVKTSEYTKANLIDFRRRMLMTVLPYDAEVEYIESTGTQYINTGIKLFESGGLTTLEFSMDVYVNTGQTVCSCIVNAMKETDPYPGVVIRTFYDNKIQIARGGEADAPIIGTCGTFQSITRTENVSFQHDIPTTIFAGLDGNNAPWRYCKLKLYRLSIKKDSILLFDAIPVRLGQVGYLYDKVSGELFGNAGTGNFIIGNDIN